MSNIKDTSNPANKISNLDPLLRMIYYTLKENGYHDTCAMMITENTNDNIQDEAKINVSNIQKYDFVQDQLFSVLDDNTELDGSFFSKIFKFFNFGLILQCDLKKSFFNPRLDEFTNQNSDTDTDIIKIYNDYITYNDFIQKRDQNGEVSVIDGEKKDYYHYWTSILNYDFTFIRKKLIYPIPHTDMYINFLCFVFYKMIRNPNIDLFKQFESNEELNNESATSTQMNIVLDFFKKHLLVLLKLDLNKYQNLISQCTVLLSMDPESALKFRNTLFRYESNLINDNDYFKNYILLKYINEDIIIPKNYLKSLIPTNKNYNHHKKTDYLKHSNQYPIIKKQLENLKQQHVPSDEYIDIKLNSMVKSDILSLIKKNESLNVKPTLDSKSLKSKRNFLKASVSSSSCTFSNNGQLICLTYRVDSNEFFLRNKRKQFDILYYDELIGQTFNVMSIDYSTKLEKLDDMESELLDNHDWFSEYFIEIEFSPNDKYVALLSNIGSLYIYQIDFAEIHNRYLKMHTFRIDKKREKIIKIKKPYWKLMYVKHKYYEDQLMETSSNSDDDGDEQNNEESENDNIDIHSMFNKKIGVDCIYNTFAWLDDQHIVLGSLESNLLIIDIINKNTVLDNHLENIIADTPIEKLHVIRSKFYNTDLQKFVNNSMKLIVTSPTHIVIDSANENKMTDDSQPRSNSKEIKEHDLDYDNDENDDDEDDNEKLLKNINSNTESTQAPGKTKFSKQTTSFLIYDIIQPVDKYVQSVKEYVENKKIETKSIKPTLFKPLNIFQINAIANSIQFPKDNSESSLCLVNTIGNDLQLWDFSTGIMICKYFGIDNYQHVRLDPCFISDNDKFVACGSENGKIIIWDRHNGSILSVIETNQGITTSVLANPVYDNHFISFHNNTTLCNWTIK